MTKATLITDSICKWVAVKGLEVQKFPGASISGIGYYISEGICDVISYNVIIIHVGTNDIRLRSIHQITIFYKALLYQVRYLNKDALIIMSAILPRPVDFNFSQSKVVQVNRILAKLVSQTKNCSYIRTYRRFIRRGRPLLKLYKQNKYRQWELHLNKSGIRILTQLFSRIIDQL